MMFSFTHILALGLALQVPLLVFGSPRRSSQYRLPPPLGDKLSLVRENAIKISTHSWELGTLAEALTELEWPQLGVFAPGSIPPPAHLENGVGEDVFSIVERVIARKSSNSLTFISNDGAVGDPASLGVSVLLCNWTQPNSRNFSFGEAGSEQLKYLLKVAPRAPNGAISHRVNQVQLWADFVYMAPPFIAYYGALHCNSLLQEAYEQVKLYRDMLFDAKAGLWRHIVLGKGEDPTHWGTANGWAVAGMLRVLETIKKSYAAHLMESQQTDLVRWVSKTLDGVWTHQQENGTLLNWIDDRGSFADASSTALLAAATFRFASITGDTTHIPAAIHALRLVRESVDSKGWLTNTVDPLKFSVPSRPGHHSPEGQSFVLLLEAAVSAWQSSHTRHKPRRLKKF